MVTRTFSSAAAFKVALETRLRNAVTSSADFTRKRQVLIFERLLARVANVPKLDATLKGGLALELRLERARTTKDVDLRMLGHADNLLAVLEEAGQRDLGDFMSFRLRPDANHPQIVGDGVQYDGYRFRAECTLAGKPYGNPFGVDLAFGDPMFGPADVVVMRDALAFAGIPPASLPIYPVETHLAEKLHAYTLPRVKSNSRMKDLPDLALLGTARPLETKRLRAAFEQTFRFRKTHAVPTMLPAPPDAWEESYASVARQDKLPWASLDAVTRAARDFLEPVLSSDLEATWNPSQWTWLTE
jgi:hypothetical protein